MRFLIQVVNQASVLIKEEEYSAEIGKGLLIYVGIHKEDIVDYQKKIDHFISKICTLQLFHIDGKLQGSLESTGGSVMLISNFTLYGENRKGNRFDFGDSAGFEDAQKIYTSIVSELTKITEVKSGIFGTYMEVSSINGGPINMIWDI